MNVRQSITKSSQCNKLQNNAAGETGVVEDPTVHCGCAGETW
ncbi:hypothetical protein [Paenibacillus planticolens]|nr:hypothetical protein [Paenibacillus planticolens]